MHAFARNKLHSHRSKSETNSPHIGPKLAIAPSKIQTELKTLDFDELPHGPVNTLEKIVTDDKIDDKFSEPPVGRRRSLTDPSAMRDLGAVKDTDSTRIRPVAV